jgi:hypothetical protein
MASGYLTTWLRKKGKGRTEHELYRALEYAPCAGRAAHGTHVMDIAAGGMPGPIIAVQLPWKPFKDTSGSSLGVHILDGLHYILGAVGKVRPVVVTISDGAYAGPQHGASLLECAIDDLKHEYKNLTIVIAAGNGREQKLHGSFEGTTTKARSLFWRVLPDVKTDSFMEIWCDEAQDSRIEITSPQGLRTTVSLGQNTYLLNNKRSVVGGVYTSNNAQSNGTPRALFLLALAQTSTVRSKRAPAPYGVWQVKVSTSRGFDAYIQRNNPALGEPRPRRQSYFLDDRLNPVYVTGEGTLNNIATGEFPIVVGGKYQRGTWFEPTTGTRTNEARYSSHGPGRKGTVPGPTHLFRSDDSPVLRGILAAGVRSGTKVRMDGTSVAAPGFARLIASNQI